MNLDDINWPPPGTYILAVSGGVDSMVLLDVFSQFSQVKNYQLVVAHFDHEMRDDSDQDAAFVEVAARSHTLKFELGKPQSKLTNEANARSARYKFLNQIVVSHQADGIITAHHEDDLIETSILNLARGSKRIGLAPFLSKQPFRPFTNMSRLDILKQARAHNIAWREDPTNSNTTNPRNFVRHLLLGHASTEWRQNYKDATTKMATLTNSIDNSIDRILRNTKTEHGYELSRDTWTVLSLDEAAEIVLAIIRKISPGTEVNRRLIEELVIFIKTAKPGRVRPIRTGLEIVIKHDMVKIYAI